MGKKFDKNSIGTISPNKLTPKEAWAVAPRPNYVTNTDLKFAYSEYPYEPYYSYPLVPQPPNQILDFWGEGRLEGSGVITGFKDAYNVNWQYKLVSNPPDRNRKIPNRIPTQDYENVSVEKYVPDSSFNIVSRP